MISSRTKVLIEEGNHQVLDVLMFNHPELLVVTGSHGIAVYRRDTGMFVMASSCNCDVDCSYHKYARADITELAEWGIENGVDILYSVDILNVGLTTSNGVYVQPDFEYRELYLQ